MNAPNNSGICTITLKDKKQKIRFGIPACRNISEMLLSDIQGTYYLDGKLSELGIAKLLYFGYVNECLVAEVDQEYTYETFVEFVEDCELSGNLYDVKLVAETWAESRITKKILKDLSESVDSNSEDPKKK